MNLPDLLYTETVKTQTFKIIVPAKAQLKRVDSFISSQIQGVSRTKIAKLIEQELITIDNEILKKVSKKIKSGSVITVNIPRLERLKVEAENIPLNVIYEDDDIIAISKQPNLVVHPGIGNRTGTLVNALAHHCTTLSNVGGEYRPGIVHRLDKDTSGLIISAKNNIAHRKMAEKFEKREIKKYYLTLVWGTFKEHSGKIIKNIGRSMRNRQNFSTDIHSSQKSKYAETHYEVLEEYEFMSLVKVRIITGRTHQIRVHFASLNRSVIGDTTYGGKIKQFKQLNPRQKHVAIKVFDVLNRQALHSYQMEFTHPISGELLKLEAPIPDDMMKAIEIMKK